MSEQVAVRTRLDVRIPSRSGTLSADLVLPEGDGPFPALFTLLPYRKDMKGAGWLDLLQWFAERGYAGILVDLSGTGDSDGVAVPKMHQREGDDAFDVLSWAGDQPWCTGDVGMWGVSSGGFTTLRAATLGHPSLKAIIPMLCPIDPDRDAFHHDGARVDLHQRVMWSSQMLLQQLLPPLRTENPRTDERWRERLGAEPFLTDLALHGPLDAEVRARAIDPSRISVPTFCVGGWRDLYARSITELYASLTVPKRLLIGPWFHNGPFDGIDFRPVALAWWDKWLRQRRKEDERMPDIVFSVMGTNERWVTSTTWPPESRAITFAANDDGGLVPASDHSTSTRSFPVVSDPTVGSLSGLWGIPNGGFGLPQDQHDDDMRTLCFTTEPLRDDLVLVGEAVVEVEVEEVVPCLVVRLSVVDQYGRSTFLALGVLTRVGRQADLQVRLRPTSILISSGSRLRLTIGDADFPRLAPLPQLQEFTVRNIRLSVPDASRAELTSIEIPPGPRARPSGASWIVSRELLDDQVDVTISSSGRVNVDDGTYATTETKLHASVPRSEPARYTSRGTSRGEVRRSDGRSAQARVDIACTNEALSAHAQLHLDGSMILERRWEFPLTQERPTN